MLTWGKGWGNRELVLDGVPVGHFTAGALRERATVVLPDGTWTFARSFRGDIVGTSPRGTQEYVARMTALWTTSWLVEAPAGRYDVVGAAFKSSFRVLWGGVEIGGARRAGVFTSRFTLDVPADVPLIDQVFLLWVVEASERRRQTAAATST